ncbi:fimbrial protein (plasmid) [Klebsiella aerogenes]|nr:fimbrial protein [Klebsiella aerogenes]
MLVQARTSTQGVFAFNVSKATVAGKDTLFKDLTDGYWTGMLMLNLLPLGTVHLLQLNKNKCN